MIEKMEFGDPLGALASIDGWTNNCANGCLNYNCNGIFVFDDDARAAKLKDVSG